MHSITTWCFICYFFEDLLACWARQIDTVTKNSLAQLSILALLESCPCLVLSSIWAYFLVRRQSNTWSRPWKRTISHPKENRAFCVLPIVVIKQGALKSFKDGDFLSSGRYWNSEIVNSASESQFQKLHKKCACEYKARLIYRCILISIHSCFLSLKSQIKDQEVVYACMI